MRKVVNRMNKAWRGSIVAVVTPFSSDGEIDFVAFGKLLQFHLENQTDGIVVCGTTGEAATLTKKEYTKLIKFAVEKVDKRIPVIAGTGCNSTLATIENSCLAQSLGVDGVLVVTPYYNKPTGKGLYEHFARVAEAVTIPVILYNVPGRTGVNLPPEVTIRLGMDFDNIVGVKEASGDLLQMAEILADRPEGFLVFSGDDGLAFQAVCQGADGVISVVANLIPKEFHRLMEQAHGGELESARAIYYRYLNLMNLCFVESNPIPVKTALSLMGRIEENFRAPLCRMEEQNRKLLRQGLLDLELL